MFALHVKLVMVVVHG